MRVKPSTSPLRLSLDYASMRRYMNRHRLPILRQMLKDKGTAWQPLTLPWYNLPVRHLEIATVTAFCFHFGSPGVHLRYVLIRDVAGKFDPQVPLSTDLSLSPANILSFFMRCWQMESTFQQVRAHLGVETQRQWSDKVIARTTPSLLELFSFVTLLANSLFTHQPPVLRTSAWYAKSLPTFSDALALVRHHLWAHLTFQMSTQDADMVKVPHVLLERPNDLLCYAARRVKSSLEHNAVWPVQNSLNELFQFHTFYQELFIHSDSNFDG